MSTYGEGEAGFKNVPRRVRISANFRAALRCAAPFVRKMKKVIILANKIQRAAPALGFKVLREFIAGETDGTSQRVNRGRGRVAEEREQP